MPLFWFSCQPVTGQARCRSLGRHAARTKTMAEFGDGTSCSSTAKTDNEDTCRLTASMQEMMGTLVQK